MRHDNDLYIRRNGKKEGYEESRIDTNKGKKGVVMSGEEEKKRQEEMMMKERRDV